MALTQIADIVQNTLTFDWIQEESVAKNALMSSGAVMLDNRLNDGLAGSGLTFEFRAWTPSSNEANTALISSDATGDVATPYKVNSTKQIVTRLDRNTPLSSSDLAAQFANGDPLASVVADLGKDMGKKRQGTMIAMFEGVMLELADTNDISIADGDASDATNWISADAVITARLNAGDASGLNDTIVMHSVVYATALLDNLITFNPINEQGINWQTYLGMRVVVDDTVTVVAGGVSGFVYTTYIVGPGAGKFGFGTPRVPLEIEREALQGNGGGVETLVVRDLYAVHMDGMSYTGSPAADTASDTEIALAANWTAVYDRKNINITSLKTNK